MENFLHKFNQACDRFLALVSISGYKYFTMSSLDVKRWYDDRGLVDPSYTPRRIPYTIAYHRIQFRKQCFRQKRKHIKGMPVDFVRDPRDVFVNDFSTGAVKCPVDFGFSTGAVKCPVDFAASPCDVALPGDDNLDGSAFITEYRSEGKVFRGVGPQDANLAGTDAEPSELSANECMPVGSRSSIDSQGLVPAPPGDTYVRMPIFSEEFPENEIVPEHVIGFSESLVEPFTNGVSPVISDIGVFRTTQEPPPVDDELVAFYNDVSPVSGAHPFEGSAPSNGRFRCSKEPVLIETVFTDFQHENHKLVTRIDNCMANFKSRFKHLSGKIENLDIGIPMFSDSAGAEGETPGCPVAENLVSHSKLCK